MTDKYGRRGEGEPCQCDASYIHTVGQHRAHDRLQESPDLMDGGVTAALIEQEVAGSYTRTDEGAHIGPAGETDWHGLYLSENRRAERAEKERDWYQRMYRDVLRRSEQADLGIEQPRPEGAEEIEAMVEESLSGDALSDAQVRALADFLAKRGVRVVTEEKP